MRKALIPGHNHCACTATQTCRATTTMSMDGSDYEGDELPEESHDEPSRTSGAKKRTKPNGYQLTNVLPLPRATTYSTQALYGAPNPHIVYCG